MGWVSIRLADPGASPIKTEEFELKGHDSVVVEETALVIAYRKKGVIKTQPALKPKKEKQADETKQPAEKS